VVGGGEAKGWASQQRLTPADKFATSYSPGLPQQLGQAQGYDDTGTYSRFFLVPKAARSDREPVLGGLPTEVTKPYNGNLNNAAYEYSDGAHRDASRRPARANVHPTVKPTDLMRHLVRLVTPTGGVVLDPFLGSGTTGLAAEMEGFEWVGIEREEEYVRIAEARLNGTQRGLGLET
jgi:site-specific DNA-methyltransferase (adenine-specific)